MERDDKAALETPSLLSSLSYPPPVAAVTEVIIKEKADTTKEGKEKEDNYNAASSLSLPPRPSAEIN